MWVKGASHAHACVFKNATAAGWGAAALRSPWGKPSVCVCVSACTRTSRIQESSVHSFCPLWPSVTSVPSHRRGGWGLRVYMRMWHFVSDVLVNGTIKPSPMLFLTLCLHGNQHICWERCTLPNVCVCGDAAVHPASSGGSTHTLHMPAAVCVCDSVGVLWGRIKSQNHIWLNIQSISKLVCQSYPKNEAEGYTN